MTLEETREKIVQMEQDLHDLKKQKHQLFQELKVVLNEDDTRKRAQQQQNYMKERCGRKEDVGGRTREE